MPKYLAYQLWQLAFVLFAMIECPACLWQTRQWCGSHDGYLVSFFAHLVKMTRHLNICGDLAVCLPIFKSPDIFLSTNSKDVRWPGYYQRHLADPILYTLGTPIYGNSSLESFYGPLAVLCHFFQSPPSFTSIIC